MSAEMKHPSLRRIVEGWVPGLGFAVGGSGKFGDRFQIRNCFCFAGS